MATWHRARARIVGCAVVAGAMFAVVGTAQAAPYWFFQGNLPLASGMRTVSQPHECCSQWQYNRQSWTPGSHYEIMVGIQYSGSWVTTQTPGGVYDYSLQYNTDYLGGQGINSGGCQNPAGYSTVYVNCRFGIGP